jgi:hypothetical protein
MDSQRVASAAAALGRGARAYAASRHAAAAVHGPQRRRPLACGIEVRSLMTLHSVEVRLAGLLIDGSATHAADEAAGVQTVTQ